jgi:hypothetical protein
MKSTLIPLLTLILPVVLAVDLVVRPPSIPAGSHLTTSRQHSRADGIEWSPCEGVDNNDITCGFYDVPLDHGDLSKGSARLTVAKYRAQTSPKLGTLFTNPGEFLSSNPRN